VGNPTAHKGRSGKEMENSIMFCR